MSALLIVLALLLAGCSLAPSDSVLQALGASERSWCLAVTSVYGTLKAGGTGVQGGSMTCGGEGLSVKDDATRNVVVPVTVSPTVTVGPSAPVTPQRP